jgi:serine/threonine-protein kinase
MWIAYADTRANALKKIAVLGGAPQIICSLNGGSLRGASWGPDETIVFATDISHGLLRVPAGGGTPQRLTTVQPAQGETDHFWPDVLPDGRAVLFTEWSDSLARSRVAVVVLASGKISSLLDGTSAHFSLTGHLLFAATDGTLRGVGFDSNRLQVTGKPVTLVDRVGIGPLGAADFDVADTGSLVYATGTTALAVPPRTLVWVDRKGHEEPIPVPARPYTYVRLSPDESRIALDTRDEQNDIWIWDLARKTLDRLTTDPGMNRMPIWTPDSTRVAFTAERDGVESVFAGGRWVWAHDSAEHRHTVPRSAIVLAGWQAADLLHANSATP